MSTTPKIYHDPEPEPWQFWLPIFLVVVIFATLCLVACSPKIIHEGHSQVVYRDRIVHDSATFEIPYEVEKIVTKDTSSFLENRFAKSDAVVSGGFLHHTLETKPQSVPVPVTVHVTDTLIIEKEAEIKEVEKEVEKPLSAWRTLQIEVFWWLVGGIVLLLAAMYAIIRFRGVNPFR